MEPADLLADACLVLDSLGVPHLVTGSMAMGLQEIWRVVLEQMDKP